MVMLVYLVTLTLVKKLRSHYVFQIMTEDAPKRQPQRPKDGAFREPVIAREIVIPVDLDTYKAVINENNAFRTLLNQCYAEHPECFPPSFDRGFRFKDFKESKKMDMRIRRICVGFGTQQFYYRVVPSAVMPYMTGCVEDVEKALFLRKFNVPYWGLAHVFGKDSCYYWRIEKRMGMTSIAGALTGDTSSESGCSLPEDIACDEKHAKYMGEKAYVAVSAGGGCVLGAELIEGADKESLVNGYGVLKDEIARAAPEHKIKSVNTDGYTSTMAAMPEVWGKSVVMITCILHLYIAIRDGCKRKYREQFEVIATELWHCYAAQTKRGFAQRWNVMMKACWKLGDWLPERITGKLARATENKLASYKAWYDRPQGHRVSTEVDRVMGSLDRKLFAMRHLRGHFVNSRLLIRAWAHIHNFAPWNPHTAKAKKAKCPAEYLMQKRYSENWLENFRIASSCASNRGKIV